MRYNRFHMVVLEVSGADPDEAYLHHTASWCDSASLDRVQRVAVRLALALGPATTINDARVFCESHADANEWLRISQHLCQSMCDY